MTMFLRRRLSSLWLCFLILALWCDVTLAQQQEVSDFKESRDTPFSCDQVLEQSTFDADVSTCCSLSRTGGGGCVVTIVNGRCKVRTDSLTFLILIEPFLEMDWLNMFTCVLLTTQYIHRSLVKFSRSISLPTLMQKNVRQEIMTEKNWDFHLSMQMIMKHLCNREIRY